jgi:hypothetical protein
MNEMKKKEMKKRMKKKEMKKWMNEWMNEHEMKWKNEIGKFKGRQYT